MTLNFNIKQKRYTCSNLQIVLNNVELVSIGKKRSRFFDFWPHDFDFAPLCDAWMKIFVTQITQMCPQKLHVTLVQHFSGEGSLIGDSFHQTDT